MSNKDTKEITPIQRLREFVQWAQSNGLCSTLYDFEKQCGLSRSYIAKSSIYPRGDISTSILAKIIKIYPMLNLVWLCTGEGKMLDDGVRVDYYKEYREKCVELEIIKKKLSAIEEIIKKAY